MSQYKQAYLMSIRDNQGLESATVVIADSIADAEERNGSCKRLKVMDWKINTTSNTGDAWFLIEVEFEQNSKEVILISGISMAEAVSKLTLRAGVIRGIDTLEFKVLL